MGLSAKPDNDIKGDVFAPSSFDGIFVRTWPEATIECVSGIAGIYHLDGRPSDPINLGRMTSAIAHRGPDGVRHWSSGPIGFGHLSLQTAGESARAAQPLATDDGSLCLVMDGRIDNRSELREALVSRGFDGIESGDGGLVLRAYACWGEDCPSRLLGDFAFAIWDFRKKQLFCARDHVGVRPFYYFYSGSLFAFGSEIRAVLAVESVPRRLNEARVVDYLVEELQREDKEATFFKGVLRLPAGHSLSVGPNRFEIRDYWDLKAPPPLKLASWQEYGAAFREVFVEAVRCRLSSTHRVGSTLSGGLDSSSVVCAIRELLSGDMNEPLHTISLVDSDESKCGETPYIREVLAGGRLVPHIVRSDEVSSLETEMANSDEPFEISPYYCNWFLFAAAKKAGVRILLDGTSGDLITPPTSCLSFMIRSLDWRALSGELSYWRTPTLPRWRILASYGLAPLMPNVYAGLRRIVHTVRTPNAEENDWANEAFAARLNVSERIEHNRREQRKAAAVGDLGTLHGAYFKSGVLPFFFEQTGRRAASMGVEARHPFSDRRVVEFFLSLPLKMKCSVPLPKMVIREGMTGILPEGVRLRAQRDHPGPAFRSALLRKYQTSEPLSISKRALETVGDYVNIDGLRACEAELASNRSECVTWSLWRVVNFAVWMGATRLHP